MFDDQGTGYSQLSVFFFDKDSQLLSVGSMFKISAQWPTSGRTTRFMPATDLQLFKGLVDSTRDRLVSPREKLIARS